MDESTRRVGAYGNRSVIKDKEIKRELKRLQAYTNEALDSHLRFYKKRGWVVSSTRNIIHTEHGKAFEQYMARYY